MSDMKHEVKRSADQWKLFVDKSGKKMTQEEVDELPVIRRRVRALKKLQFDKLQIDGELEKAVLDLIKSKFHPKYQTINEKRAQIINGSAEPTDEECHFETDSEESGSAIQSKDSIIDGIPGFWLKALQNYSLTREWISRRDEAVLIHLKDIAVIYGQNPTKLILEFRFEPNEYFANEVLTKEYEIKFGPDPKNLWNTNPYFAVKWKGCRIDWKKGKNLIEKKLSSTKSAKNFELIPSFFCFFDPPQKPKDKCELDEDLEDLLWEDWQIGLLIARNIVPNAVLSYDGDLVDDETESESSESSESDSSSIDSESQN